jgi:hypothetical protein
MLIYRSRLAWMLVFCLLVLGTPIAATLYGQTNRYTVLYDDEAAALKALRRIGGKKLQSYKHFKGLETNLSPGKARQLERLLGKSGMVFKDDYRQMIPAPNGRQVRVLGKPGPASQETPWGIDAVRAQQAWQYSKGAGALVAVIDTGIDGDHPDIAENVLIGANYVNDRYSWDDDVHGHGTHVAGTIAALDNEIGVVGVAPEASLIISRVINRQGSGTCGEVADGIYGAMEMRDVVDPPPHTMGFVINLSLDWGCPEGGPEIPLLEAVSEGAFVVAAAGNFGYPGLRTPADLPGVYGATALDETLYLAEFSNYGFSVEAGQYGWAAPGVGVLSLWKNGGMNVMDGTSMATPHAAGVAALMFSSGMPEVVGVDIGLPYAEQGFGLVDALETVNPTTPPSGVHDVAILDVEAPPSATPGSTVEIDVDVRNEGTYDETTTVILTDSTDPDDEVTIGEEVVTLAAGASKRLTFSWDTASASPGVRTLIAFAEFVPEEDDVTDNEDTAEINLADAPEPGVLSVGVVTSKLVYSAGDTVPIYATVTDQLGIPIKDATVQFDIISARNKHYYLGSDTTDSDGNAAYYWGHEPKHGTGFFIVDVIATKAGYEPGAGSTMFEVQ